MRIRHLGLVAVSLAILAHAGCATTSGVSQPRRERAAKSETPPEPPAPTPRYSTGRAMQDFAFPYSKVQTAVFEAMDDLGITVTRENHDGPAGQIEGRTADNRAVTVTLRPHETITRVSCRVGWWGDEPYSRAFLRRLGIRLGVLPPEAIPDKPPSAPASNPYFSRDAIPNSEMMRDFIEAPYRNRPDM
jgi:Protein of unknown function (DUF3568)